MKTLKHIKKTFADEMFYLACEQDYEDPQEFHNMANDYAMIDTLDADSLLELINDLVIKDKDSRLPK